MRNRKAKPGSIRPTKPCDRCDVPAEASNGGAARINGHMIDDLTVCVDCLKLVIQGDKIYFREGWKRYPPPKTQE